MRIEYKPSTGNPFGQFVVHAENDLERTVLHNFLEAGHMGYTFWLHGSVYSCNVSGDVSFNFGWIKKRKKKSSL